MHSATLDQAADRLRRGYRFIRTVSPPDAPWPGALTRSPDATACVLVDADLLGPDWRGWDAAASGHLLAPLDVVRRPDGHDVALAVCAERVDMLLARRDAAGTPLSAGEVVTLAVSILRGVAELQRSGTDDTPGQWWLTDEGRPMIATGVGEDATETSRAVLAAVRTTLTSRNPVTYAVDDVLAALADPRVLARDLERLEEALFDAADAAPIAVASLDPRRARTLAAIVTPHSADADPPRRAGWADLLATHVDGDMADLTSQAVTRVWRGLRTSKPGNRRRPWLLAAGLAAGVLVVGLLWPTGNAGPATADAVSAVAAPTPEPGAAPVDETPPSQSTPAPGADGGDVLAGGATPGGEQPSAGAEGSPGAKTWGAAAAEILALRTACGSDTGCLGDVVEDPRRIFPAGVVDVPASGRTITLLDEFGGAAVLRVDPVGAASASQLIVLVSTAAGYRLRDVHDVAEPVG